MHRLVPCLLVVILVAGCGGGSNGSGGQSGTAGDTMQQMTVTSPAFDDGERIPDKYGYTQENVNPPLHIEGVPEQAESLVLIMDDPDAIEPAGKIWDHWVAWDIDPTTQTIPEDSAPAGGVEGRNDYGELGYGGPNPPDREHTYHFRVYALDTPLNLPSNATREDVEDAMDGHVIVEAELTGTFSPEQT